MLPTVIFLDIQGVLIPNNSSPSLQSLFSPLSVSTLNTLINKYNLVAVISSDILCSRSFSEIKDIFKYNTCYINIIDHVPKSYLMDNSPVYTDRHSEIQAWLDLNKGSYSNYLILDDTKMHSERLVLIDGDEGLTGRYLNQIYSLITA
jgi:hypothetical protein